MAKFLAPVSVHLLLVQGNTVLLLRRYNTGYEDGNYSLVAGHVEGGEEITAAMIREASEEAGVGISPSDLEVVGVIHSMTDKEYVHFFLKASQWSGEVRNMEPNRCNDLSWHDFRDLPDNTVPYVRRAIENYRKGVWFDSFGW